MTDTHRTHDADATEDEDVFKVEVLDSKATTDELEIHIEALQPKYEGNGMPYEVKRGDSLSNESEGSKSVLTK